MKGSETQARAAVSESPVKLPEDLLPLSGGQLIGVDDRLNSGGGGDERERRRIEIRLRRAARSEPSTGAFGPHSIAPRGATSISCGAEISISCGDATSISPFASARSSGGTSMVPFWCGSYSECPCTLMCSFAWKAVNCRSVDLGSGMGPDDLLNSSSRLYIRLLQPLRPSKTTAYLQHPFLWSHSNVRQASDRRTRPSGSDCP
jgi:hypothetical protein